MSQVMKRSLEEVLKGEKVHFQLSVPQLVEKAIQRGEGRLTSTGAFSVFTGKFTGRSPKDKYIVDEPAYHEKISWGDVNRPIAEESFEKLYQDVLDYLLGKELFVFDGFAGADPDYRLPIRVVSELAWHNLFGHQLFIRPTKEQVRRHIPEWHVIYAAGFNANPAIHGTKTETFIIISFEKKLVLIGGTQYAGEMKKSIFSVMNAILPEKGILSMHCSANVGNEGDVALFFGLSGTGKTTLSADPNRFLIGDDEHGWSDTGIFNIEGGCYAKCINLSKEKEPQIYNSIRFGAVLENVVIDPETRIPDFDDNSITENTRAAYPVDHIDGAVIPGVVSSHPRTILFLTADAFGVLPPISKLTPEQAMYHYLSGYTSKLAGTERGVTEPEATFSSCFGAPFLPLHVSTYAKMLGERIKKYRTNVYLVNTGWSGGPYGVGKRINLTFTRAMVTAALNGDLEKATFTPHPIFGLLVPDYCPGVPSEILDPVKTWSDPKAYEEKARELAKRFEENFARMQEKDPFIGELSKNW